MLGIFATLVVVVAIHELGHVVAAACTGHRVFEVQLGVGPAITWPAGDVIVRVGMLPVGGSVQAATNNLHRFRRRSLVVASAGCLANATLAAVAFAWGFRFVAGLSAAAAVVNLVPTRRRFGAQASDGRVIIDLLLGRRRQLQEDASAWWAASALRARERGNPLEALALVADGREVVGESLSLSAVHGLVLYDVGDFTTAATVYARLAADPMVSRAGRAGFAADAAWALLLSGSGASTDIVALAEQAGGGHRRSSSHRKVALGLGLAIGGDPDRARSVVAGLGTAEARVVEALVAARAGNHQEARQVIEETGLARDHPLVVRVVDTLGMPETGSGDN